MTKSNKFKRAALGTAIAAVIAAGIAPAVSAPALAQPSGSVKPTHDVALSVGTGRLVQLDGTMSDLFVANDGIADVQVRSSNQIYIFGKAGGETTIYATSKAGKVIYSANVRVGTNIGSVDEMLDLAMPDAQIRATSMNGMLLLTGTVATPADVEEAGRLVQAFVGEGTRVVSRLKTATPLQVMLKVKIAEVSRSLARDVGVNLLTRDNTGGFLFGVGRGNPGSITDVVSKTLTDPITGNPAAVGTGFKFRNPGGMTTLGFAGNLLGVDILSTLNLNEASGLVTTLAEPTLTALSGETASFLAGGEFPIPTAQGINGTSVEFKEYGVSLAFTPVVLEGGRISMRVRPEVSEISSAGAVKLNGFEIPALTTRRAETTVELGSGQSFMIGGLLRNNGNNSVEKAPFLGDIPILGALFRSNSFRRNETELVIVVTPYLVKPVSASQIALPTDGYRHSNDAQRILLDQREDGRSGERRPEPVSGPPQTVAPGIGALGS
ncbi:MAG TPA: type II and III secretion system protein family protein, partial [Allosphingosinicella sp.]